MGTGTVKYLETKIPKHLIPAIIAHNLPNWRKEWFKENAMDRVFIERHCAFKDMYDDGGYCETRIKKYKAYYWASVKDGNGETMCSECMLQCLLHQLSTTGTIPKYKDSWKEDFELLKEKQND